MWAKILINALLLSILGLGGLTACDAAHAVTPDPGNSAHCIAAFGYGRTIMLSGHQPDIPGALNSTARSLFEMKRLEESGGVSRGEEEGAALLRQLAADGDSMMKLLKDCLEKQDADPAFRAANSSGVLMAAARKVDPVCRDDAACRAGEKN
jgi:hypothetical protein